MAVPLRLPLADAEAHEGCQGRHEGRPGEDQGRREEGPVLHSHQVLHFPRSAAQAALAPLTDASPRFLWLRAAWAGRPPWGSVRAGEAWGLLRGCAQQAADSEVDSVEQQVLTV